MPILLNCAELYDNLIPAKNVTMSHSVIIDCCILVRNVTILYVLPEFNPYVQLG